MHLQLLILTAFGLLTAGLWHYSKHNTQLFRHRRRFGQLALGLLIMAVLMALGVMDATAMNLGLAGVPIVIGDTERELTRAVEEMRDAVGKKVDGHTTDIATLKGSIKTLVDENDRLRADFAKLQKQYLQRSSIAGAKRRPGFVSDECARNLAAVFILGQARNGRLDALDAGLREKLFSEARSILGIEQRTALTTTDVPLPSTYFGEIRELVSEFGVVRREMFPFPLGLGTSRPPRFKTRPSFGSIAMSASIAEKSPQIDFATLESHKIGGIVRLPREIDDQSIVPMGQFLARYGAIEFARAEDTWGFLADGSGTYESVKGVTKIALDNSKVTTMGAGLLSPSEVTVAHIRAMRGLVSPAALSQGAKYYFHSTMEAHFRTLNTAADPYFFVPNNPSTRDALLGPGFTATLDGFPIVWTDVFPAYTTGDVAANSFLGAFGALQYWWFAERGNPRLDMSSDVYFTTDEIGARFLEEIDFDYQSLDAASALRVPAA